MKIKKLSFSGRAKPRAEFLSDVQNDIAVFLEREISQDLELHLYLREIVKNIYDHNNGYGVVKLEKINDRTILVVIKNTNNPTQKSEKIPGVNYKVGLQTIQSALQGGFPGISLKFDPKNLYQYKVTYTLKD